MPQAMFKLGDRLRHKASEEVGIVLAVRPDGRYRLSLGFNNEVIVAEDLLVLAAPVMAEIADDGSLIEDEGGGIAGAAPVTVEVMSHGQAMGDIKSRMAGTIQARVGEETLTLTVLGRRGGGLACQGKGGIHLVLQSHACDTVEFDRLLNEATPFLS